MSTLSCLHPTAVAFDLETFSFVRALMAPPIVCAQIANHDGAEIFSRVVPTAELEEVIVETFSPAHEQIWGHNILFDLACCMEWHPRLRRRIWQALHDGRVLDTMYLQRMIQILKGQIGGALALDAVAKGWGVPPPTKEIEATHPDYPGEVFDVRLSFGLWYYAKEIPNPWYDYADYDAVATLRVAAHQVAAFCQPKGGHRFAPVRLEDLAWLVRRQYGLYLSRTYGLKTDPKATVDLGRAARAAQLNLQEAAIEEGFLKPKPATGAQIKAGQVSKLRFCKTEYENPPKPPKGDKDTPDARARYEANLAAFERRVARHQHPKMPFRRKNEKDDKWEARWKQYVEVDKHTETPCRDCGRQALDEQGNPHWQLDTDNLIERIVEAYEGDPPLTEPTKQADGTFSGGGNVSRSRDTLQDSQDPNLEAFAQYNEYTTLQNKDLKILAEGVVHTHFGIANTTRPTSSNPNILNFRRTGFTIAECPQCEYQMTIDPKNYKRGDQIQCPNCGQ